MIASHPVMRLAGEVADDFVARYANDLQADRFVELRTAVHRLIIDVRGCTYIEAAGLVYPDGEACTAREAAVRAHWRDFLRRAGERLLGPAPLGEGHGDWKLVLISLVSMGAIVEAEDLAREHGHYLCLCCRAVAPKQDWGPGRVTCPACGKKAPSVAERASLVTS